MNQGKYVFAQIMETVCRYDFDRCVKRYQGERWTKSFSCWEQFLAMIFGQLAFRKSLRDIAACLGAHHKKLYHLGFRSKLVRTTLAYANENRDWRIYRDFATMLITEARRLHANDPLPTLDIKEAVYTIDSTTIDLCLSLFPWARRPREEAEFKLHLGLELHGNIPAFFAFSDGGTADVTYLDAIDFEAGAYYIFDRGYHDFRRFYRIHETKSFFVTRAKSTWSYRRQYSRPVDKSTGLRFDQTVVEGRHHHARKYPGKMRRIGYYDAETKLHYVFVTNNFDLPAGVIAELYRQRWQVELFFKWIKQHLSVEMFWGRSANAVKTQVCIAVSAYLLVSMLKKQLGIERNSYEILQILSVSLFDKTPVFTLVSESSLQTQETDAGNQAGLWDY